METQKFSVEWRDTDFLCVGGGIAGLMAAINAAEQGMDCVVLEKADTRRSGSGCGGNDHFFCYLPEVHGPDIRRILREMMLSMVGDRMDTDVISGMESGMSTVLVLSGVSTRETIKTYAYRPSMVLDGVGDIVALARGEKSEE